MVLTSQPALGWFNRKIIIGGARRGGCTTEKNIAGGAVKVRQLQNRTPDRLVAKRRGRRGVIRAEEAH